MNSTQLPNPEFGDCQGTIHPKAILGIELFNQRKYWLAHEALEAAWLGESGQIRHLYRGILQIAVTYYHIQKKNYRGAVKVYHRSKRWVDPFPDQCRGLNLGQLRADVEMVIGELQKLGPDQIGEFNINLLRPLQWVSSQNKSSV